jgi:DNA-binding response OmpR family regulator
LARILLVDDEPALRQSLAAFLKKSGHDVRVAANGVEAIAALREAAADVVVTDINMPGMDGIEMLTAMRRESSKARVIAMSGGGMFDKGMLLASASVMGADVTLAKPFDLEQLRQAIDTVLAKKAEGGGA